MKHTSGPSVCQRYSTPFMSISPNRSCVIGKRFVFVICPSSTRNTASLREHWQNEEPSERLIKVLSDIITNMTWVIYTLIARYMGPIWSRQDPSGPHVDPMNCVIWAVEAWIGHYMNDHAMHPKFRSNLIAVIDVMDKRVFFFLLW